MVNYKQYNLDHWTHSVWMLLLTSLNYYNNCQTRIHHNLKSYCELRHFLILRLKTGMDEGNFNIAGNLFHNILRLYLIHLCPKVLLGQLLDVPKFVCVRPGSLQRSLRPLAAFEGTLCGRKGRRRWEEKGRKGREMKEGKEGRGNIQERRG